MKSAVAGEGFSFKVEARDRFLNKRGVGGDAFRLQSAQRMQTSTKDHGDGSYTVSCTLFEAGSNTCCVMLGDGAEGVCADGMRADVTAAGVDVKNCRVSGAGLKGARAGEVGEVVVTLRDEFGNNADCIPSRLRSWLDLGELGVICCGFGSIGHGCVLIRYSLERSGNCWLCCEIDGTSCPGFPQQVHISPAEFESAKSRRIDESCLLHTCAGDTSALLVQALDRFGNVPDEVPADLEVTITSGSVQVLSSLFAERRICMYWLFLDRSSLS